MSYLDILNETRQNMATANPFENIMRGAQGFNQIQNQLLQNQQAQQTLEQNAAMNPLLMQSRQAQLQGQQVQNQAAQMEIDDFQKKERLGQLYRASQALKPFVEKGDFQGASAIAAKLTDYGLPEETAAEVQRLAGMGDGATMMSHINTIESLARDMGSEQTAEMRTFNAMIEGMTPEEKAGARKVWAGIQARAGESAQERIARTGMTGEVAQSEAEIAAAKAGAAETAELDVQLEKKPQLEAKVEQARLEVQAKVEKQIAQQGQLGRLGDAQMIYSDLMPDGPEDLSKLSRIYGRGESFYPKILRSQEGINTIAQRDQLVSMLQLGARGELKGQGPITENEQAILSKAITILSEPDIEPKLAARYINQAMTILGRNAGKATTPQANDIDDLVNQYAD